MAALIRDRTVSGRVILVEDDPGVREVLTLLLRSEGWEVVAAADGAAGLTHARRSTPDLVVTDLRMPGMSGIELAAALADDDGVTDVPVVAITSDTASVRGSAQRSGRFYAVLDKPLEPSAFLATVREAVRPEALG